jgi:hypothetical protein
LTEDQQREIEQMFITSWDEAEQFYRFMVGLKSWEHLTPIFGLMAEFRERGYDRQLRAGHSHELLVLFRSRIHYPKRGQHSIQIDVIAGKGMAMTYFQPPNPKIEFIQTKIEITPEIEDLLKRLLAQPID